MLAVAEINYFRHEENREWCFNPDIAKKIKRDPRTVKKYSEMEELISTQTVKQTRIYMYLWNFLPHL
ncbi:hypothetical protein C0971_09440 [Bacillus methanolicus]|uniref:hypothetical protein n=1 Tax=Bacillus methanolicus TaxID=1471 RepID=UPI00200F5CD0|nr:hypothetical protein [Bacillus methanolicus]UQD52217.1 hypothetical protein C0971_09440 [Bacillus methanolicus]